MQRRSFRALGGTEARYPRLCELGSISRFCAFTLGGMLFGGAACTPGHAAPGSEQAAKVSTAPESARDSGTPPIPQPRPTAGVPVPQRIDPPAKDTGKTDVAKKDTAVKSTKKSRHDGAKKDTAAAPTKTERNP